MRIALLVAALAFCSAAPAFAQKVPPPSPQLVQREPGPPPSPEALAAARDLASAMLIESRIISTAIDHVWGQNAPQLRALYANLPGIRQERRRAALAFIDTVPTLLNEELTRVLPEAVDRAAPEIAALFSESELAGIANFMREPETRGIVTSMVTGDFSISNRRDMSHMADFAETPAGRAFAARGNDMNAVFRRALENTVIQLQPVIEQRVLTGLCLALEDDCPASVRSQIGPT